MSRPRVLRGEHRVIVEGTPLRFYLRLGEPGAPVPRWRPTTDTEFQHRYEDSLFDQPALRRGQLRPNPRRMELTTTDGWWWSDGYHTAGICTFNDGAPAERAGLALQRAGGPS